MSEEASKAGSTKVLYFAWLRERIGLEEEFVDLPDGLETVADLLEWMAGRNEQFANALENRAVIRVAVNQKHIQHDQPIGTPREIALFPPMTGG